MSVSKGVVKWFSPRKGYGFITPDGPNAVDLFVHFANLKSDGFRTLYKDQRVQFTTGTDKNGKPQAADVANEDGTPLQPRPRAPRDEAKVTKPKSEVKPRSEARGGKLSKKVKLYYTPTSCGASNFIAAFTAGLNIECEQVVLATHKTASGADFYAINPKGNVPALVLENGTVLNENAATLQYIADLAAPGAIAPPNGTQKRYELQTALSYISGEFHGTIGQLFNPNLTKDVEEYVRSRANLKLKYVNDHLIGKKQFLVGDKFTVADAYLYIVLSWSDYLKLDLSPFANIKAYYERIKALPNVKQAHERMSTSPTNVV